MLNEEPGSSLIIKLEVAVGPALRLPSEGYRVHRFHCSHVGGLRGAWVATCGLHYHVGYNHYHYYHHYHFYHQVYTPLYNHMITNSLNTMATKEAISTTETIF